MDSLIALIEGIYQGLGIDSAVGMMDLFGIMSIAYLILATLPFLLSRAPKQIERKESKSPILKEVVPEEKVETAKVAERVPKPRPVKAQEPISKPWSDRLKKGLSKSRNGVFGSIGKLFGGGKIDPDQLEEIEELLYSADIGPKTVMEITDHLEEKSKSGSLTEEEFKKFLHDFLREKMEPIQSKVDQELFQYNKDSEKKGPKVIMVVGVNGAGKTTTIGKLATKLTNQGANVVVGACDTFRAAAVDQLQVWVDRAGATMIRAKEGAAPSGVGYEALQHAINEKADYCILDTAGRLHTKDNLMDELSKSKNVLKKLDEGAPHQTLLVIDAITGQNATRQAQEFNKALKLDGLIFTKCDGSSKAGSAVAIVQDLQVPIVYIGVGESVEDLNIFELSEYLDALLEYA